MPEEPVVDGTPAATPYTAMVKAHNQSMDDFPGDSDTALAFNGSGDELLFDYQFPFNDDRGHVVDIVDKHPCGRAFSDYLGT